MPLASSTTSPTSCSFDGRACGGAARRGTSGHAGHGPNRSPCAAGVLCPPTSRPTLATLCAPHPPVCRWCMRCCLAAAWSGPTSAPTACTNSWWTAGPARPARAPLLTRSMSASRERGKRQAAVLRQASGAGDERSRGCARCNSLQLRLANGADADEARTLRAPPPPRTLHPQRSAALYATRRAAGAPLLRRV